MFACCSSQALVDRGRPIIDDTLGSNRLLGDQGTLLRGVSLSWDGGDSHGSQKKFMPSQESLDALAKDCRYKTGRWLFGNTDPVGYNAAGCDILVDRGRDDLYRLPAVVISPR
jgi:hypothetical protein